MRKILITVSMLAVLICMLALTVSAYESFGALETITGIELSSKMGEGVSTQSSANARVKLSCTCAQGSHTFPSYYIMEDASESNAYGATVAYTVFDSINSIGASCGNKAFSIADVLSYELPDGVTNVKSTLYTKDDSLKNITFLDYSTATTLKTMTKAGDNWYNSSKKLEEIRFPASLENISEYSFFSCTNLTTIVIPKNSQLKIIGEYSFRNCTNLEGVYLPNGIEAICGNSAGAFEFCAKLWLKNSPDETEKPSVYYFPETLNRLDEKAFQGCAGISETVVIPSQITSYEGWELQGSGAKNYIFKGFMTKADYVGAWTYYFVNPQNTDPEGVSSACGWGNYTLTKVFCYAKENETHLVERTINQAANCTDNACTVSYCFCNARISEEEIPNSALGHDKNINNGATIVAISYEINGKTDYMSDGYQVIKCARCGAEDTTDEAPALFTCLGYSSPEFGKEGIVVGYEANEKAIEEYEKITKKTLTYGVFAVSQSKLGDNAIFDENGAATGVIFADVTKHGFALFELKIIGFADEQKDLKLAMGAYVAVTDGETTEYSYMQGGEPNENERYSFVSYNDIVGAPPTDEEGTN